MTHNNTNNTNNTNRKAYLRRLDTCTNIYNNYRTQLTPHPTTRLSAIRNAIYFYSVANGPFDNETRNLARHYYNNLREALN